MLTTVTVTLPEEAVPAFYRFLADVFDPAPAREQDRRPCAYCDRPIPPTRRADARYCDRRCRTNAAAARRYRRLHAVS